MKYIFFLLLIITGCTSGNEGDTVNKPNILFIISDDQAWNDYSFMGHKTIKTPNIDKLAGESLTFTRGYVTSPLCSPSLATMLSGLYPYQHMVTGNDPSFNTNTPRYSVEWRAERLEHYDTLINAYQQNKLLTEILSDEGYISFQSGKWWLGSYKDAKFDFGMTHGDPERNGRHGDFGLTIGREGLDTLFNFIDYSRENNKPFFTWYAPFLPHAPHNPPDSILQKYLKITDSEPIARYQASCEWFDITVGQLLNYLDEKDLRENTVIIYVCDNGWIQNPDRQNQYAEKSKRTPYEMGIRTPIMVNWPGTIKPAFNEVNPVSSIDMVPTILDILNIDKPSEMKGLSLLKQEKIEDRNTVFSEVYLHDMKDMMKPSTNLISSVIIQDQWKLILPDSTNSAGDTPELYNILDDPYEKMNILENNPSIVAKLKTQLTDHLSNFE